jgi:hypothetical protein
MSQQSRTGQVTRRQVLRYGGIAAGTASALAGCSALNSDSGPLKSVTAKPGRVTVTLTESADIDAVQLQPPGNADVLNPTSVGSDQTSVELPLVRNTGGGGNPAGTLTVPPEGIYTVEAVRGEETVATRKTARLVSNPRITAITAQTSADADNRATGKVLFTLTTGGVLPDLLTHLSITGVPNPLNTDLAALSLTGSPISRQSQTGQSQNARLLIYPTLDNTFAIDAPPLQLSIDTYQKYVQMDTEYPQLPEPCKTRQWSGKLTTKTARTTLTVPFRYSFGGKTREAGSGLSGGGYMCSNASITPNLNTSSASASSTNASANNSTGQ